MTYFKVNGIDFSNIVSSLSITKTRTYNAQTNAHGDTVVDYLKAKRNITVGIIPLTAERLMPLLAEVDKFQVSVSFQNPNTNALEENVSCIIPTEKVDAYTLQQNKKMYKALSLTFREL